MATATQLEKSPAPGPVEQASWQGRMKGLWGMARVRWAGLPPQKRALTVSAAALLAVATGFLLWYTLRTDWRTLYSGMDPDDARATGQTLVQAQIPFEPTPDGTGIRVPANQLDKASRDIIACLKALTEYHKERYKLEVRQIVMPGLPIDADLAIAHREEAIKAVKRKFAEVSGELPFYPELIEEILLEDFSSDGPRLRDELLRRLAIAEEKKPASVQEKSFKNVIIDGARALSAASFALEEAVAKLQDDSSLLASLYQGLGARLKRMIRKLFSPEDKGLVYQVSFSDPVTGSRTTEAIDFGQFVEETNKKARILSSFAQRQGPSIRRIEGMTDDQAYKFLQRNIEEIQRSLRILAALEEFFKTETAGEAKSRVKLVRAEITTIKGAVIKANQKKHEYVAQREETEQMRRLGIKDTP